MGVVGMGGVFQGRGGGRRVDSGSTGGGDAPPVRGGGGTAVLGSGGGFKVVGSGVVDGTAVRVGGRCVVGSGGFKVVGSEGVCGFEVINTPLSHNDRPFSYLTQLPVAVGYPPIVT